MIDFVENWLASRKPQFPTFDTLLYSAIAHSCIGKWRLGSIAIVVYDRWGVWHHWITRFHPAFAFVDFGWDARGHDAIINGSDWKTIEFVGWGRHLLIDEEKSLLCMMHV